MVAWIAVFFLFLVVAGVGLAAKERIGLSTCSGGIAFVFALGYLVYLLFALMGLSAPRLEVWALWGVAAFFLALAGKRRLPAVGLAAIGLLGLWSLGQLVDFSVFARPLFGDENVFWFPGTKNYLEGGLLFSMKHSPIAGYGQFTQHIWVTLVRLSPVDFPVESVFWIPTTVFFLALLFAWECGSRPWIGALLAGGTALILWRDGWVRFMFFQSLYAEGIIAWIWGVIFLELVRARAFMGGAAPLGLWLVAGAAYGLKPFASYLIPLTPFLVWVLAGRPWQREALIRLAKALLLIAPVPLLWSLASWWNRLAPDYYSLYGVRGLKLENLSGIISHHLQHRSITTFQIGSIFFLLALFWWFRRREELRVVLGGAAFLVGNCLAVLALYVFVWHQIEVQSAFRYILQTVLIWTVLYGLLLAQFADSLPRWMSWISNKKAS
jgi:hypothetical protein